MIWGREWDPLLAADTDGALVRLMNVTPDGDYQTYKAESGAFVREHFFGRDPRTARMVEHLTDDQIWSLRRGGHDYRKLYAAYRAATAHTGQPTVILAKTIKGWTLGSHFEGRNSTHQMKKLTLQDLKDFRDRLHLPIADEALDGTLPPYHRPPEGSDELDYLHERRHALGGYLPDRRVRSAPLALPGRSAYATARRGSGTQRVATTMAFVRLLKDLMKDPEVGHRFVPIIPDEARTFGMDALFPSKKIYSPHGQHYLSVDRDLMLSYQEDISGVLLHEGITEAGSVASWTAAGTSYATHGEPMIPVYIFYSMFGFQRTGDGLWAAADQMTRGFLLGATAGRTTLNGEGLQHQDGHSPLLASTNPACVAYDAAYAFELGHIVRDGLRRMYGVLRPGEDPNVFYYLTLYNEPIAQPAEPDDVDVDGIVAGMHRLSPADRGSGPRAQLLASGIAVPWALDAQRLLQTDSGVHADVVCHLLDRTAPTSAGRGRVELRASRAAAAQPVRHPAPERRARARGGRLGLDAGGTRPDRAFRAGRLVLPGHRRIRAVRHPAGAAAPLRDRRPLDRAADVGAVDSPPRAGQLRAGQGSRGLPTRGGRRPDRQHCRPLGSMSRVALSGRTTAVPGRTR